MKHDISGTLGLCKRAQKLGCGVEAVRNAVRQDTAELVLLTCDASDNTRKRVVNICTYYKKKIFCIDLDSVQLGKILGMSSAAAVAVCDKGFAKNIEAKLPHTVEQSFEKLEQGE